MATVISTPPPHDANKTDKTNDAIYPSKLYKTKSSQKIRALITFAPRTSLFDIGNKTSGVNEFRGFYSLFWISIFIWTVRTYITSIETHGRPLNLDFATMFSRDAKVLAISDFVLILSTGLCVVLAKAISKGWLRYFWTGVLIQHALQTTILFSAIKWTFDRKWPWVQSGFLTLHSLVLIMKMHSYLTVNGHLQYVFAQSQRLLRKLQSVTETIGGWEQALQDANPDPDSVNTTRSSTPNTSEGSSTEFVTTNVLRRRLSVAAASNGNEYVQVVSNGHPYPANTVDLRTIPELNTYKDEKLKQHPLVFHPDPQIASLAKEYSELQAELTSPAGNVTWPNNITWKNFAEYMLIPSLVYELEYPRTKHIRPLYIFEKTVATFGTFALLYTVTESFILPLTPTSQQSFFRSLLDLALPFMISYLLLFYIIFECICNGFAEISRFADRQFYEDWVCMWNSTSWDEFSRKWNKPVHAFLLRHIYAPLIYSCGFSKTVAMLVTFFFSACAHELVMVVVTQKIRLYLFTLQIVQIPLILVGRHPVMKRHKLMGNVVFWLGLYAGFPLLCVAYVAY